MHPSLPCPILSSPPLPAAQTDDNDYLASSIAMVLLHHVDAKYTLPRHTLHLTDVGSHLRAQAAGDARLAAIFPRNRDNAGGGGGSGGRRVSSGSSAGKDAKSKPRLSEFVSQQPRYFRVADSQVAVTAFPRGF
jgi:hypothetical protein